MKVYCKNCIYYHKKIRDDKGNIITFGRDCREQTVIKKSFTTEKSLTLFGIPIINLKVPENIRSKYMLDVCGAEINKHVTPTGEKEISTYEGQIVFGNCHDRNKNYQCGLYVTRNIIVRAFNSVVGNIKMMIKRRSLK
jgi:hypothetical protein